MFKVGLPRIEYCPWILPNETIVGKGLCFAA